MGAPRRKRSRLKDRRERKGFSREALALEIVVDRSSVHRWEEEGSAIYPRNRLRLAGALGLDVDGVGRAGLDWYLVRDDELLAGSYSVSDVERREFLSGAAALAATGAMQVSEKTGAMQRLGVSDVARLRAAIQEFQALDDQSGGVAALDHALDHLHHVHRLMDTATYGATVGRDLRVLAGEITDMAGWFAYDAGQHDTARRLWTEALCAAQLTENDRLTVLVMTDMSIQAAAHGNPREAVELSQAAQRTARPFATPRLLSLLSAREARAHALLGDAAKCHTTLWESEQLLDEGQHPDDPEWLDFWGPADFYTHVALAQTALGAPREAEQARRAALNAVDPAYPRNEALYLVGLAEALVDQDQLDEGATYASAAIQRLPHVSSGRLRRDLRALRPRLAAGTSVPAVQDCLDQMTAALA